MSTYRVQLNKADIMISSDWKAENKERDQLSEHLISYLKVL